MPLYQVTQSNTAAIELALGTDARTAAIDYCRRRFQILPDCGMALQIELSGRQPNEPFDRRDAFRRVMFIVYSDWNPDNLDAGITWTAREVLASA